MLDIQNTKDIRKMPIDQVGISDLTYPIIFKNSKDYAQHTIANVKIVVDLPHHLKGTHMSRLVEVLNEHHKEISIDSIPKMLEELKLRLKAKFARIEMKFPYFIRRKAPVSKLLGYIDCECTFIGESNCERKKLAIAVKVPITSLCPCSKAISQYGAHNQRGHVNIEVNIDPNLLTKIDEITIDELIDIATESGSAPIHSLLKREDERYVTMRAYENPVFVEDIVRYISSRLKNVHTAGKIIQFQVQAINYESIHNHNAFASVRWPS